MVPGDVVVLANGAKGTILAVWRGGAVILVKLIGAGGRVTATAGTFTVVATRSTIGALLPSLVSGQIGVGLLWWLYSRYGKDNDGPDNIKAEATNLPVHVGHVMDQGTAFNLSAVKVEATKVPAYIRVALDHGRALDLSSIKAGLAKLPAAICDVVGFLGSKIGESAH